MDDPLRRLSFERDAINIVADDGLRGLQDMQDLACMLQGDLLGYHLPPIGRTAR